MGIGSFYGYVMTEKQKDKLVKILEDNILERYNNEEYWDVDLVNEFAHNHNLKTR